MLTDIELVSEFSQVLGEDYRIAKSYVRDVPTQALLHIRSFTHKLTDQLAQSQQIIFDSPNLYDHIETLNRHRVINVRITRSLHRLRGDGNRGAHPEKYHLTADALQELAQRAIERLLRLVVELFPLIHQRPAPEYQFEPFDSIAGRDLCYRAIMENDHQAQYLVGMSLKTRALMQREQEQALEEQDDEPKAQHLRSADSFKQAAYWFAQAAPHHIDALYEYGVSLLHGYNGEPDVSAGETAIIGAAKAGVANAMALLGYFYLVGGEHIEVSHSDALHYLQAAAALEHSEAMANLGVLYYQQGDYSQAYHYISTAANAGFPHAQYHLALMLARGEGCEPDALASQHWMAEAAEQGQLDAMLNRAQQMLNSDNALGDDYSVAERYLRQVVKYGHSVPAMIELSIALADGILGRIDVVGSAALLNMARARANEQELAVISPLWRSLVAQIDNVLAVTDNQAEVSALERAKELLSEPI
ncbi:tetratricopeptide repeat protein [Shewanella algidipiscicola]|uniref:tetratricopeptide repeat protein n=1 Tax=Shewanella algidipiscicola TaxID=614070 RepID=UPI000D781B47|nr:tetratricopeptide repeat protein [Shewanella algidipiscicola]